MRACAIDGCDRCVDSWELCKKHYDHARYTGELVRVSQSKKRGPQGVKQVPIDRIMASIVETPGPLATPCWINSFTPIPDGYTKIKLLSGSNSRCHIVTYEHFIGPVPIGMQCDHLCRVRACCNPHHIEPVTSRENKLRGESVSARAVRTGLCKRGHSLDDAYPIRNGRRCRVCSQLHAKARWHQVPIDQL